MNEFSFCNTIRKLAPKKPIETRLCIDYAQLVVVLSGKYESVIEGIHSCAESGDVFLFPPWLDHVDQNLKSFPYTCYVTSFTWSHPVEGLPSMLHDNEGRIRLISEWLHSACLSGIDEAESYCHSHLAAMVSEYIRLSASQESHLVQRIHRFISRHIEESITLQMLADHVHLSKFYFAKKYKVTAGVTPFQEVRNVRIQAAQQLLLTTTLPVKEIARCVGLSCEAALSHMLRKYANTTASDIRKQRS